MKSWKTLTNWYVDYELVLLKSLVFLILGNLPLETPSCPQNYANYQFMYSGWKHWTHIHVGKKNMERGRDIMGYVNMSEMTLTYRLIVERYPFSNEVVGGSIPDV